MTSYWINCPWPTCKYGMYGFSEAKASAGVRNHLIVSHGGRLPDGCRSPVTAREQKQMNISFRAKGG